MTRWLPVINSRTAEVLGELLGWVEDRDYWLSPDMPLEDS